MLKYQIFDNKIYKLLDIRLCYKSGPKCIVYYREL